MTVSFIVSIAIGLVAVAWYVRLCVRYALCVDQVKKSYKYQEIPSAKMLCSIYKALGDEHFSHYNVANTKYTFMLLFPTYETFSREGVRQRHVLVLPSQWEYQKYMWWEKLWGHKQDVRATKENKRGNRSNDALRDMSKRLGEKIWSGNETAASLKVKNKIGKILDGSTDSAPAEDKRLRLCPFCGWEARIAVCDDEGNIHPDEYRDDPWSGLKFSIIHDDSNAGVDCPIATCEGDGFIGRYTYDTEEEAIAAWNNRVGGNNER